MIFLPLRRRISSDRDVHLQTVVGSRPGRPVPLRRKKAAQSANAAAYCGCGRSIFQVSAVAAGVERDDGYEVAKLVKTQRPGDERKKNIKKKMA
jgi:hypothetical protein